VNLGGYKEALTHSRYSGDRLVCLGVGLARLLQILLDIFAKCVQLFLYRFAGFIGCAC
jgi:hypothetical protein